MNVSDIRIRKTLHEGRLRAVVSITIDNAIAVHDIKIIQGEERLFVAMPNRLDENGVHRDIVHPINSKARFSMEESVLKAYADFTHTEEPAKPAEEYAEEEDYE